MIKIYKICLFITAITLAGLIFQTASCTKADVSSVTNGIDRLRSQNDSLLNTVLRLQLSLDSVRNKVNQNTSIINSIYTQVNVLQVSVSSLINSIKLLNTKIDSANFNLASIQLQINVLNKQYQNLSSQIGILFESISNQIDSLSRQTSANDSLLNRLQKEYLTTQIKVDSILLKIILNSQLITTNSTDISQVQSQMILLTTQYNNVIILLNQLVFLINNQYTISKVGDLSNGGIVFYVDSTNRHGLIASSVDQSSGGTEWGCYCSVINGTDTAFGTGMSNTINIVQQCTSGVNYAAKICKNLSLNGYTDWYLPSKRELLMMYSNLKLKGLGNFSNSVSYWSSSAAPYGSCGMNGGAWTVFFGNGTSVSDYRSGYAGVGAVRAIRSF